jgi:hypothetical protein
MAKPVVRLTFCSRERRDTASSAFLNASSHPRPLLSADGQIVISSSFETFQMTPRLMNETYELEKWAQFRSDLRWKLLRVPYWLPLTGQSKQ